MTCVVDTKESPILVFQTDLLLISLASTDDLAAMHITSLKLLGVAPSDVKTTTCPDTLNSIH